MTVSSPDNRNTHTLPPGVDREWNGWVLRAGNPIPEGWEPDGWLPWWSGEVVGKAMASPRRIRPMTDPAVPTGDNPRWTVDEDDELVCTDRRGDHAYINPGDLRAGLLSHINRHDAHAALVRCVRDADQLTQARERDIERFAAAVHQAYLDTCARLGWTVKPANAVPYSELPEDAKELDRASVRAVLDLLTETPDDT